MLITITNTTGEARGLGFLLHKNLGQSATFSIPAPRRSGAQRVFCWKLDPVELVRGAHRLENYVNDWQYVASSYLTVAMGRSFGPALGDSGRGQLQ